MRNGPNTQKLTRDQIVEIVLAAGLQHFDETIHEDFQFPRDFDRKKLRRFLELAEIRYRAEPHSLLTNLGVAQTDGATLRMRQAGVLFFAREPQRHLRESFLTAIRYEGTDRFSILDRSELFGDPIAMIEDALAFVRRNTHVREVITGEGRRRELHEYPMVAVREAVINAVMHRDYYYDISHIYLHIFADRLEVESPGSLPFGLRFEDLGKRSVRRNRLIADLLFRVKYVERIGSGIRRMERALAENGNPPMEISATNFVVVRFYPRVAPAGTVDLTGRQSRLCQHLAERGPLSKSDLAELLSVSGDTILRDLRHLLGEGVVERQGSGRATRYVLSG